MNKAPLVTLRKLCKFLTVTKTLKREILVELDVPDLIKNVAAVKGDRELFF